MYRGRSSWKNCKKDNVRVKQDKQVVKLDCDEVDLDQVRLPDPIDDAFSCIVKRLTKVEAQLRELEEVKKDEVI